ELDEDPEYLRRVAAGEIEDVEVAIEESSGKTLPRGAALSAWMFLAGVAVVVCGGLFPALRTVGPADARVTVSMPMTIAIVMFTVATGMLLFAQAPVHQIVKTKTCQAGLTAVIGILGLAWLGDTFIDANRDVIVGGLSRMAEAYP